MQPTKQQSDWINAASCVDAAYERLAIVQGLVDFNKATFAENREEPTWVRGLN